MGDIRKKVLEFAKDSEGKRIWARLHNYSTDEKKVRSFLPLKDSFSHKKQSYKCSHFVTQWEEGASDIIYSDRDPENDFQTAIEKKAKERCNIGHGECWDLAYVALDKNNGLKALITYSTSNRKWSDKRVKKLDEIKGGEIIELAQFFCIKITKTKTDEQTNLSWQSNAVDNEHTAIIASKVSDGEITVYQQNVGHNRHVHKGTQPISSTIIKKGNKIVYQACGGNRVKSFIEQATTAGKDFAKLEKVISKVEEYIKSAEAIPAQIKIYIPMSNP